MFIENTNGTRFEVRCKRWTKAGLPKKILAIRYQALGDTMVPLPYLQSLKRQNPYLELHLLTRQEVSSIPNSIDLFDRVITVGGGRSSRKQFLFSLLKLPLLWAQRYDVVLDLQNHKISNIIRKLLTPPAWAEFDKYSDASAGDRCRSTIEALKLWKVDIDTQFKSNIDAEGILRHNNWNGTSDLIVLNPAGCFPSRNWPLEYYVNLAKLWLESKPDSQFVLLLLPSLRRKADYIRNALGEKCIDLTGKANQAQAFAILQKCKLVVSEDGGLMHMAWIQGVPTLALFSSSRRDWSAPLGSWSDSFDSSDLECGPCSLVICKYGDNRCLTRYEPAFVFSRARDLLSRNSN